LKRFGPFCHCRQIYIRSLRRIAKGTFQQHFFGIKFLYWLNDKRIFPQRIRVPSARQVKYNDRRAKDGGKMPDNLWEFSRVCGTFREKRKWHPCQLPEQMIERIIFGHSNPGDTVLDPFVGSGTTLYCCDRLSRHVVGIDQSQLYLDKIREEREQREQRRTEGAA